MRKNLEATKTSAVVKGPQTNRNEHGRAAYFVLWLMGVPVGVLLLLWVLFGSNLFGPG